MHTSASDLAILLEADLYRNGWRGVNPAADDTVRQMAMRSLHHSFLKKFHNEEVSDERDSRALELFTKVNNQCRDYRLPDPIDTLSAIAIGEAQSFIYDFCFIFHPEKNLGVDGYCIEPFDESILGLSKIEAHCGFGSGSNIGARSGDPYGKLAISNLTYSEPALLSLFQQAVLEDRRWNGQELFRSTHYPTTRVQGSKLSFVPKTSEITRTICTEPILNMFFQKGIAALLERRLAEVVGIDLSTQPDKNRELARRGSLTGQFGTIDLSSASDSMSLTLVRKWFPPSIVRWLELTRCKKTVLKDGSVIDLHMVSSMGNAYTFPLQTLFFTSLVVGAYKALDIKLQRPFRKTVGNFAVFGDDIIVDRKAYGLVTSMLNHCGFTVNHDKSFNTGLFRESCGSDFWFGHNIRGVYLKKLLDDLDCYSAFNRLAYWSARHGVNLQLVLEALLCNVSRDLVVPFHEDDEAGFKIPLALAKGRVHYLRKKPGNWLYFKASRTRCFVKLPASESEVTAVSLKRIRRRIPFWRYCPDGLLLLLLHGNISGGRLLLRSEGRKAEYSKKWSPCWDYIPSAGSERAGFEERLISLLSLVWFTR